MGSSKKGNRTMAAKDLQASYSLVSATNEAKIAAQEANP